MGGRAAQPGAKQDFMTPRAAVVAVPHELLGRVIKPESSTKCRGIIDRSTTFPSQSILRRTIELDDFAWELF